MKFLAASLTAAIALQAGSPCFGDEERFDVFLLIGQSNMAGRAKVEDEDAKVLDGAVLWNIGAKAWEPAKTPFNRYSPMGKGLLTGRWNDARK